VIYFTKRCCRKGNAKTHSLDPFSDGRCRLVSKEEAMYLMSDRDVNHPYVAAQSNFFKTTRV
jgi:hypothetical protein